ncbi:hypothetical protein D9758_018208 [Tetrapyrgos nigripes]|uniref:Uncharacterized protein n=1 Tax=Tetrapyrgos nigripes TaxID=182062 RepID=A0A8H5FEQ6_9AGAR|nr:hypothetical protein D9758_018208 [Tetrapyrgos nigripes]
MSQILRTFNTRLTPHTSIELRTSVPGTLTIEPSDGSVRREVMERVEREMQARVSLSEIEGGRERERVGLAASGPGTGTGTGAAGSKRVHSFSSSSASTTSEDNGGFGFSQPPKKRPRVEESMKEGEKIECRIDFNEEDREYQVKKALSLATPSSDLRSFQHGFDPTTYNPHLDGPPPKGIVIDPNGDVTMLVLTPMHSDNISAWRNGVADSNEAATTSTAASTSASTSASAKSYPYPALALGSGRPSTCSSSNSNQNLNPNLQRSWSNTSITSEASLVPTEIEIPPVNWDNPIEARKELDRLAVGVWDFAYVKGSVVGGKGDKDKLEAKGKDKTSVQVEVKAEARAKEKAKEKEKVKVGPEAKFKEDVEMKLKDEPRPAPTIFDPYTSLATYEYYLSKGSSESEEGREERVERWRRERARECGLREQRGRGLKRVDTLPIETLPISGSMEVMPSIMEGVEGEGDASTSIPRTRSRGLRRMDTEHQTFGFPAEGDTEGEAEATTTTTTTTAASPSPLSAIQASSPLTSSTASTTTTTLSTPSSFSASGSSTTTTTSPTASTSSSTPTTHPTHTPTPPRPNCRPTIPRPVRIVPLPGPLTSRLLSLQFIDPAEIEERWLDIDRVALGGYLWGLGLELGLVVPSGNRDQGNGKAKGNEKDQGKGKAKETDPETKTTATITISPNWNWTATGTTWSDVLDAVGVGSSRGLRVPGRVSSVRRDNEDEGEDEKENENDGTVNGEEGEEDEEPQTHIHITLFGTRYAIPKYCTLRNYLEKQANLTTSRRGTEWHWLTPHPYQRLSLLETAMDDRQIVSNYVHLQRMFERERRLKEKGVRGGVGASGAGVSGGVGGGGGGVGTGTTGGDRDGDEMDVDVDVGMGMGMSVPGFIESGIYEGESESGALANGNGNRNGRGLERMGTVMLGKGLGRTGTLGTLGALGRTGTGTVSLSGLGRTGTLSSLGRTVTLGPGSGIGSLGTLDASSSSSGKETGAGLKRKSLEDEDDIGDEDEDEDGTPDFYAPLDRDHDGNISQ